MPVGWAIVIIVQWLAIAALAVVTLGVLRQVTGQLERAPKRQGRMGPTPGTKVPSFAAVDANGAEFTDAQLRGKPNVFLFLSSGCGPCAQLAAEMRSAELDWLASALTIFTDPGGGEALGLPAELRTAADPARKIATSLDIEGRPFAVAVDESGIVRATRVPNTVADLSALGRRVIPAETQPELSPAGTP
jgi:hypothetical protein